MNQTNLTLKTVIKNRLRHVDFVFLTLGCLLLGFVCLFMTFARQPDNIFAPLGNLLGFALIMSGVIFGVFMGGFLTIWIGEYYKPRVLRIVNAPNEIETLKDWLIAFGSYATSIDNDSNKNLNIKKLGKALYHIAKQLNNFESRIQTLENSQKPTTNETDYNRIIADQRRTIFDLNLRMHEIEGQLKEKKDDEIKTAERFDQLTNELMNVKEELKRLQGG